MATYKKNTSQDQEVFINFRGADLHHSFVRDLEMALKRNGINVYIDQDDELSGVDPRNLLANRIEESKIALAIFSSKYTESSWCLNELVKIKERVEEGKLVVFPIFYKMNPSEVKELEGDFGFNLWNQVKHTSEFDKLKKWKEALDFVSHKAGLILTENRY